MESLPLRNDDTTALGDVAVDEIDGLSYPVSKIGFGADRTYTGVSAADPLPVTGTFDLTQAAGSQADGHSATLGAKADAAAAGDTATASLVSLFKRLLQHATSLLARLPAALTAGGNLKVSLQETNAPQPITDNGGSLTVDGTVAATQSGTWNIGTVATITNVVHVDDNGGSLTVDGAVAVNDAGGSLTVDGTVSIAGTVTAETELTTADLDTGAGTDTRAVVGLVFGANGGGTLVSTSNPLPIGDNGGSLTVDGTVAATQSGTWNIGTVTTITNVVHVDDNGGTLSIDDGGASLTVDGTIAATQSGTWNIGTVTTITNVVHVDDNGGSLTVDGTVGISGTVAVNTELTTADLDTGAGTDTRAVVGLVFGANGGGTLVSTSNPLPIGDNGGSLTVDGTVAATQSGTWNIGTVATITNVVHVDDNGGTLSIDDGGASLTVDGTVAATQSGAWNIGTVTTITNVVHVDDNAGSLTVDGTVSITGAVDTELTTADLDTGAGTDTRAVVGLVFGASGGGTLVSTSNPLPIGDNGGSLSVDDNGGSLTVDGTVAATQSGAWNIGTLTTITNVVHVDDNAGSLTVDGSVSVAPVGAFPVQIDSPLPTGTNVIGGVTQSGTWNVGTVATITNVVHVDDNAGSLTVDGSVSVTPLGTFPVQIDSPLPTGTNVIGGVTQSGTWNVGTVTTITNVVHVDDNAGSLTVDGTVSITGAVDTELTTADLDTGAGTDTRAVVGLVFGASGGGTLVSTSNPLPIGDNGGSLTVDGTVAATQSGTWNVGTVTTITNVVNVADNGATLSVDDGGASLTVDGTVAATQSGTWNVGTVTTVTTVATVTSITNTVTTKETRAGTGTLTNVAGATSSTTVLASNANRLGATVFNDSAAVLYLKFGSSASSTSFTVRLRPYAYYEVPANYTGILTGIWTAATGSARVTELT